MPGRRFGLSAVFIVALALAGCGDHGKAKPEQTPAERIAAALDPCAQGKGSGKTGFAESVCQNETLAHIDQQVRETLVAETAEVSDAGGQMLVQNEQRWRDAQRIACGVIDPATAPSPEQAQCLENRFRARLQEAANAVHEQGGYTFQRVELVDATPVTAQIAEAAGLGEDSGASAIMRDIRFPRIDGPQTPQIQRFNELVAQQPQYRIEDATDEIVDYQIAYAGPEIISVRFNISENSLGSAHPNDTSKAVTVMMSKGEPITADDVFTPGSGWQDYLTGRAMREITRQFADYNFVPPIRDVRDSATKPHLWLVTDNALVILFPPYSFGGSHVMGGTEVSIPWTDLARYLNPNAPAPIHPAA